MIIIYIDIYIKYCEFYIILKLMDASTSNPTEQKEEKELPSQPEEEKLDKGEGIPLVSTGKPMIKSESNQLRYLIFRLVILKSGKNMGTKMEMFKECKVL